MRVAVFGAGALGSVYGARLLLRGRADVTWIVRPSKVGSIAPIAIERARKGERETVDRPERAASIPADADAVLLAVGTEDLDGIRPTLEATDAPIVVLTPMLPRAYERMRAAFGGRVFAAMPNVVAYARAEDGVVRYWLPPAPTRIDEPRPGDPHADTLEELVRRMKEAGLWARLELGVHETNPATTVCFIAIGMAFAIAKSADALARDETLLSLTTRACREGVALGRRLGRPEPWAIFAPALAAPWAVRAGIASLARASPEALHYAEEHFGRKLAAQHRLMIREMIELAGEKRLGHTALDELSRLLAG